MNNQELLRTFTSNTQLPPDAHLYFDRLDQFKTMMMMYNCAIREVRTKLEVLNDELSVKSQRNPIESIKSRIKSPASIVEKLRRRGFEVSLPSVMEHLNDVAGIRVICSFLDDIYYIAHMLSAQDDINVIQIKDYIKKPKANGYRSYHMIVEVPVFFSDHKENLRVEIQIRTIAMDFWSSLEHKLKYKKDIPHGEEIAGELKKCADVIAALDERMLDVRNRIDEEDTF